MELQHSSKRAAGFGGGSTSPPVVGPLQEPQLEQGLDVVRILHDQAVQDRFRRIGIALSCEMCRVQHAEVTIRETLAESAGSRDRIPAEPNPILRLVEHGQPIPRERERRIKASSPAERGDCRVFGELHEVQFAVDERCECIQIVGVEAGSPDQELAFTRCCRHQFPE
jgi:hypothetical protein